MRQRRKKPRKAARRRPAGKTARYLVWIVRRAEPEKARSRRASFEWLELVTPCRLAWRSAMLIAEGFNRAMRDAQPELFAMAIPAEWASIGTPQTGLTEDDLGA